MDEHNHALAALRYLISRIDERRMARRATPGGLAKEAESEQQEAAKILETQKRRQQQLQHLWMHPGCWASWGS